MRVMSPRGARTLPRAPLPCQRRECRGSRCPPLAALLGAAMVAVEKPSRRYRAPMPRGRETCSRRARARRRRGPARRRGCGPRPAPRRCRKARVRVGDGGELANGLVVGEHERNEVPQGRSSAPPRVRHALRVPPVKIGGVNAAGASTGGYCDANAFGLKGPDNSAGWRGARLRCVTMWGLARRGMPFAEAAHARADSSCRDFPEPPVRSLGARRAMVRRVRARRRLRAPCRESARVAPNER